MTVHSKVKAVARSDKESVAEGNSILMIRVTGRNSAVRHFNSRLSDGLVQAFTTPKLGITNPGDNAIAITEFWVDIQHEGEFKRCVQSKIGTPDYYGDPNWHENQSFSFYQHDTIDLYFEGHYEIPLPADANGKIPAHLVAMNGRPYNQRSHPAFSDPMIARLTIKDDSVLYLTSFQPLRPFFFCESSNFPYRVTPRL